MDERRRPLAKADHGRHVANRQAVAIALDQSSVTCHRDAYEELDPSRSAITGSAVGDPWISGSSAISRKCVADAAGTRIVCNDVDLGSTVDADAARGEPPTRRAAPVAPRSEQEHQACRRPRDGGRTASAGSLGRAGRSVRQQGSFWRKPVPVVPTIETISATTAEAVSMPPAPGPSSVISRMASPSSVTALKAPSTAANGVATRHERWPDTHIEAAIEERGNADETYRHPELARCLDVAAGDRSMIPS